MNRIVELTEIYHEMLKRKPSELELNYYTKYLYSIEKIKKFYYKLFRISEKK